MNIKSFTAAACLALMSASASSATTFDFFWNVDPVNDPTVVGPGVFTDITVSGTIDINVANGASFVLSDVTGFNLLRTGTEGSNLNPLGEILPILAFAEGSVSTDGTTAAFTDFGTILNAGDPRGFFGSFGCLAANCSNGIVTPGLGLAGTRSYGTAGAALASFSLNVVPDVLPSAVPLPAGGLLLLSGFVGIAGLKRRKKRTV